MGSGRMGRHSDGHSAARQNCWAERQEMTGAVQLYGKTLPEEVRGVFIERLAETGNVTRVCAELGVTRQAVYYWRHTDQAFNVAWESALDIFNEQLTAEVIDTARALGTGQWVPVLDDAGDPVLNDNFERLMTFETARVDARILAKLIDKRVRSVEGPNQTAVIVNNTVNTGPRPAPRLIQPSPDASEAILEAELAETFEATQDAPYEPFGTIPELEY